MHLRELLDRNRPRVGVRATGWPRGHGRGGGAPSEETGGRDEETVAGLYFVPIHQTIFGLWHQVNLWGVGDIFLSVRGLPSLATRSRPLHAWWVGILHSVIGCQAVAAIAAGWLVDGYPIWL
ncbi:uncharacterized protein PgNI_08427 [Pyricularia grisea]|uniref:Uncharacterized protein n=1 Tax=Pyricularia grisea TaxID=148305 RepID=A0A6P8AWP6_PYRGI|nr:uncharacterized protein PgNI_08427 [Pyricularia grisea]TLD06625.1 hypothetical protein PgNI_08427 [Pyricularia grisea]